MKKFIYLLMAFVACVMMFNSCGSSANKVRYVDVQNGSGETVKVDVFALHLGTDLQNYMRSSDVKPFVQKQCDILKNQCTHERTFVPTSVEYLKITDEFQVKCGNSEITIYTYSCVVKGYAKNGFGTEGDVEMFVGTEGLDEPRFVIKNDFSGEKPSYLISKRPADKYDILEFNYKGKTYTLYAFGLSADDFAKKVNS